MKFNASGCCRTAPHVRYGQDAAAGVPAGTAATAEVDVGGQRRSVVRCAAFGSATGSHTHFPPYLITAQSRVTRARADDDAERGERHAEGAAQLDEAEKGQSH